MFSRRARLQACRNRHETGVHVMFEANRRIFLQSFAAGAGALATSQSFAAGSDGHAAGYDVSAASDYLKTIPRKSGDPVVFTASLDKGPILSLIHISEPTRLG